ncbi:MAG: GntR family transcriptional regulator [Lentisphaeria bacterium]|nr:GntR family transcriptional regulator [Lentisphaeria bacterium]
MAKEKNAVMSEVTRVRLHIMEIIYRNSTKSVMIPSVRTLAAGFGIARSTVQLALEELSRQGYVIGKPGIGTFTNPQKGFSLLADAPPLIGMKVGTGDYFYYGSLTWNLMAHTGISVTDRGWNLRQMNCATPTAEELLAELRDFRFDGLLCIQVPDKLLAAAAAKIPLVNIGRLTEEVSCVHFRYKPALRELCALLDGEKRRRLLSILPAAVSGRSQTIHAGIRKYAPESELRIIDPQSPSASAALEEALRNDPPDALLLLGQQSPLVSRLMRQYGITPQAMLPVATQDVSERMDFPGVHFREPLREGAEAGVELLQQRLCGGNTDIVRKALDVQLIGPH